MKRVTRAYLVGFSVAAVAIGAGCGGAGSAAVRAIGRGAGTVGREAVHVAPAAYRPAVQVAPVVAPRPVVTGAGFRVGERVERGAAAGQRPAAGGHGWVDVPRAGTGSGSDDDRK